MSYQVLARKWRPRTLLEMVGQEPILRMLANALDQQRLHHAYLFTGTRGVGKTSLARILAKCLNCETGITSKPCGTCTTCQAIDSGRFLDLIEIDAASRTKVEDTREILDNVQYSPSQGRFKIYLIDEVHMLSGHSFNALLKTLEEPPAHVKFLLATTDPKRLPITILSRCLQFNLKRVPIEQITQRLQHICKTENISYEEPALALLAKAADGSMRDALSLLDQAIAYCGNQLNTSDTRQMLGSIEQEALYRLLNALAANDGCQLLAEIKKLAENAPDFSLVLAELLSILHQINITQVIQPEAPEDEQIRAYVKQFTPEEIQLYYQIALIGRRDLSITPNPAQGFEMVMLRMLAFRPSTSEPTPRATIPKTVTTNKTTPIEPIMPTTTASNWSDIIPKLELTGLALTLATNCKLASIQSDKVELTLAAVHQPMLNSKLSERIESALNKYLKKPIKLDIKITTDIIETPAKQYQQDQANRLTHATDTIKNDDQVKKMMDMFSATLDIDSIKAI